MPGSDLWVDVNARMMVSAVAIDMEFTTRSTLPLPVVHPSLLPRQHHP